VEFVLINKWQVSLEMTGPLLRLCCTWH